MFSFLRASSYSPLPSNFQHVRPKRWHTTRPIILAVFLATLFSVLVASGIWAARRMVVGSPPYNPLRNYQHLDPPALVAHQPSGSALPPRRAIVSALYSDSYAIGVAVLGHSAQKANTTARLVLLYLEGRISDEALCVVRTSGWEPVAVPFIAPPHGGQGIYYRFMDQYTKLNIWGLDRLGIAAGGPVERAVYLDADTLVLRNFDELFDIDFNFAAVPDIYGDSRGFTVGFNAGVMAFHPSTSVLNTMKAKLEEANYPLDQAEQAFLNLFFGATALRLPYAYNANLAIKTSSPALWEAMKGEMRIVHYTLTKPFMDENHNESPGLFDEERQRQYISQAANSRGGSFREEVGWWEKAYDRMMKENHSKLESCRPS